MKHSKFFFSKDQAESMTFKQLIEANKWALKRIKKGDTALLRDCVVYQDGSSECDNEYEAAEELIIEILLSIEGEVQAIGHLEVIKHRLVERD